MTEKQRVLLRYWNIRYNRLLEEQQSIARDIGILEKEDIVKKYLSLVEVRKEIDMKVKNHEKDSIADVIGICSHDIFIYMGKRITSYGGDEFLFYDFACIDCRYKKHISAILTRDGKVFDEGKLARELSNFCHDNIVIELSNKETYDNLISEYFSILYDKNANEAKNYALQRRKYIKHQ